MWIIVSEQFTVLLLYNSVVNSEYASDSCWAWIIVDSDSLMFAVIIYEYQVTVDILRTELYILMMDLVMNKKSNLIFLYQLFASSPAVAYVQCSL